MGDHTCDYFLGGGIVLHQPRSGYRFSIDAVILAHLAKPAAGNRILDLGTGCGVIPVMVAYRHPGLQICGVEIQAPLAELARRNVSNNKMADHIDIVHKDMRQLTLHDIGGPVDLVVTNPPYRKLGSGRLNSQSQQAVARHELAVDLEGVLTTAGRMLNPSGRMVIIYPSVRSVDLLVAMRSVRLEPKILTMIHSDRSTSARLVVVEGAKGGGPGLMVAPPLYLYREDGNYTNAVEAMLS
ncbi:MAG: SAM-dependent methyltransferase [Proteobacteria bacterium]|nr:MAG: SAM-dependent methyltransferase [Pseudomonadota bacterium]